MPAIPFAYSQIRIIDKYSRKTKKVLTSLHGSVMIGHVIKNNSPYIENSR